MGSLASKLGLPNYTDHRIAAETAGHRPPPPSVVQSFSESDLRHSAKEDRNGLIVHHGDPVDLPGFELVQSHRELAVLFSSRGSVPLDLPLEDVLLQSRVPFVVHSAELNRRAFSFAARRFGTFLPVESPPNSCGDYRALAERCLRGPEIVAIGLRGIAAGDSRLAVVTIDGVDPLDPSSQAAYPLQYWIHLYVRTNQPDLSFARVRTAIGAISHAIEEDAAHIFSRKHLRYTASREAA